MTLILQAVQGANWQRAGGKGKAPERIQRPDDRPPQVQSADDLMRRRAAQRAELARRKQAKRKGA